MKLVQTVLLGLLPAIIACSRADESPLEPVQESTEPVWSSSVIPAAAQGVWYNGGAEQVVIFGDSLEMWESFRYLTYQIFAIERSDNNHYRMLLQCSTQYPSYKLAELILVQPNSLIFSCSSNSTFDTDLARQLALMGTMTLTAYAGWQENDIVPDGLEGNWLASDGTSELIIRGDTLKWKGEIWPLAAVQWLPGGVRRLVGVRGSDTLAVYPAEIGINELTAIVRQGTNSGLDRRGRPDTEEVELFSRWWFPLGEEHPSRGTVWEYSYYSLDERFFNDGGMNSGRIYTHLRGRLLLEVLDSGSPSAENSISILRTVQLDTLHIYGQTSSMGQSEKIDSLVVNLEYDKREIELYYDGDMLWTVEDTVSRSFAPRRVIPGAQINARLFGINDMPVIVSDHGNGRIELDDMNGVKKLYYLESSYTNINGYNFNMQCELLRYSSGL